MAKPLTKEEISDELVLAFKKDGIKGSSRRQAELVLEQVLSDVNSTARTLRVRDIQVTIDEVWIDDNVLKFRLSFVGKDGLPLQIGDGEYHFVNPPLMTMDKDGLMNVDVQLAWMEMLCSTIEHNINEYNIE